VRYEIETTNLFDEWLNNLKGKKAINRIMSRLYRVEQGNFGDHKVISAELFELRFFFGSGYRIYYTIQDGKVVLLLSGGDKSSQGKDIEKAKAILNSLENEQ